MKKLFLIALFAITLPGCSWIRVHKLDVEQGNIITQAETSRLHAGMTTAQVKEVMGSPVLSNIFAANQVDYVYTYKPGYGTESNKRLICHFKNGRLQTSTLSD